jgi:hypothetical protein
MIHRAIFWNIGKLTDYKLLGDLCSGQSADLVLTAEDTSADALTAINATGQRFQRLFSPTKRGINFYSKHPEDFTALLNF